MSFPTTGYNPAAVTYFIGTTADASLSITAALLNSPAATEELLGYLETALSSFRTAYEGGTEYTLTMNKSFEGQTTPVNL